MFLDKLWVRIKGELLSLREDATAGDDLRAKAAELLDRLQDVDPRAGRVEPSVEGMVRADQTGTPQPEQPRNRSLAELESAWQKLMRQRDEQKARSMEPPTPTPNPRRLG
jgi:hypothetical protein